MITTITTISQTGKEGDKETSVFAWPHPVDTSLGNMWARAIILKGIEHIRNEASGDEDSKDASQYKTVRQLKNGSWSKLMVSLWYLVQLEATSLWA